MKRLAVLFFVCFCCVIHATSFDEGFRNPSDEMKPWCYWYWLEGNITKEGISKDLESMAEVGIKRAMIGNITLQKKTGPIKMMSPEWIEMTRYAFKEAKRTGVALYMFNGPGWSQSGGPWIKPEQSMRRITWREIATKGGAFSKKLRPPEIPASQDVAVLAVPQLSAVSIEGIKKGNKFTFSHSQPFTARALLIDGNAKGKLYALHNGKRTLIETIDANRGNPKTDFLVGGLQAFSFKDTQAKAFEFVMAPEPPKRKRGPKAGWNNESMKVILTSEPKITKVFHKQMGRMHPTPAPTWESYIFKDTVEPNDASVLIKQKDVLNLSGKLKADGTLNCTLPKGKWNVIYFGMVPTGKLNHPAPPEATGFEVDKMSKKYTRYHFNSQFNTLMQAMTVEEKAAFKGITIDSYEVGAQNWTDGFESEFMKRNGYDPIALLPVMTGRVIDSAKSSEQFLWDLRRSVSDMIAENYVGELRKCAHEQGLTLWCENYGHWGFPGDFLIYGGYSDEIGGEFWVTPKDRGTIECRAASSAAHIYGKRRVFAEAFTNRLMLEDHPYKIKARGEELFCEGINHFVLHVYVHQPSDGTPGTNPWFGTPFHRNTPWFNQAQGWVKYLQRCHYMLQQGESSADVAVYIGDFAPQMTGPANPVPAGYDYDYVGSDAILRNLNVVDGEWVIYDEINPTLISARYKVMAMPKLKYIRPHVQKRIDALIAKGGKIVQGVPVQTSTLERVGVGPVVANSTCSLRWKSRKLDDGELFFLSNFEKTGPFEVTLRVKGKVPELFNPVRGEIKKMARYSVEKTGTRIFLDVKDLADSYFIVFRDASSVPSIVDVSGGEINLFYDESSRLMAETNTAGEYKVTTSEGKTRSIIVESESYAIDSPWKTTKKGSYIIDQETTFTLPASFAGKEGIMLDLGKVEVMAKVTLNGSEFECLWMPPFVLDVTKAIKEGANKLSIQVTSTSKGAPKLGETIHLRAMTQTLSASEKPNVLLISIDDLNDWIGCMDGHSQAKTPNIDRLAKRGVLFANAHCQSPVCNPSRASMMTSLYPETTGIYFLSPELHETPITQKHRVMPMRFHDDGYHVAAAGKLFHHNDAKHFPIYAGQFGTFGPLPKKKLSAFEGHRLWDWGAFPDTDEKMPDYKIAAWGVKQLEKSFDKPFFLATGFYRPHVPQYAPKKWFDLYPMDTLKLPKVLSNDLDDLSEYAVNLTRLKHVSPGHDWVVKSDEWKPLVQSYLACVSFVDHQVGKVIDALDKNKQKDNTIIVLYSDHGFHLGEKERWAKRSIWQDGARVPMIIAGPGIAKGKVCSKPVQLLDIYPTLLELSGLVRNPAHEGQSLAKLLKNPEAEWSHMARSSFGPGNVAIISERYRYIHYNDGSEEFYDHKNDPNEWNNQIKNSEMAPLIEQHRAHLPEKVHPVLEGNSTGHKAFSASEAIHLGKSIPGKELK
ncbi:MAG: sulfatase-like hydrolase/transferase [Planctomycetes bacterium]|nr:sulfatase-like hydrolase/transferase [Planctomycetota bacterium]